MENLMDARKKEVEIGSLPFTWVDVLKSFEVGQERRYRVNGPTMVLTVRGNMARYQKETGTRFSSRVEGEYIYITRVE